jgi:hypothetical protein
MGTSSITPASLSGRLVFAPELRGTAPGGELEVVVAHG